MQANELPPKNVIFDWKDLKKKIDILEKDSKHLFRNWRHAIYDF